MINLGARKINVIVIKQCNTTLATFFSEYIQDEAYYVNFRFFSLTVNQLLEL